MKTILIGSLVGAIILFGWQAFSWTVSSIHDHSFKHTANQETILQNLPSQLQGEGEYYVPSPNPEATREEKMKFNEERMGKEWMLISYHPTGNTDMGTTMLRGFLTSFVCVLLVCLVIRRFDPMYRNFISISTSVLTFGVVSFLFVWYNQHNWFQTQWHFLWGEMIDNLMSWALCGVWLGWWYSRKNRKVAM